MSRILHGVSLLAFGLLILLVCSQGFASQAVPITDGGFVKQADAGGSFVAPSTGLVRMGTGYDWKASDYSVNQGDTVQCDVYATGLFGYSFGDIPAGTPCPCYMVASAEPPADPASGVPMNWSKPSHVAQALCVGLAVLLFVHGYRSGERV